MELHHIAVRALGVYLVLLGLIRLSGKRTLAQATPFDFVLSLILGDMIDDALWAEVPIARFVAGTFALTVIHVAVCWAASRSEWLDGLIAGGPATVMSDGQPLRAGLRKERMSEQELAVEVRHHGVEREDWPEVQAAHIEASGVVSLLKARWARPAQRRDAAGVRRLRGRGAGRMP